MGCLCVLLVACFETFAAWQTRRGSGSPGSYAAGVDYTRFSATTVKATCAKRNSSAGLFAETVPEAVINLAAESHVDRSITGSRSFIETNIIGTYTLLEAARCYWSGLSDEAKGSFRFLHVSTDEVYGSLGADGFFTESTPYDPSSPYSASKAASDHLATAWHRTYDL